MRTWMTVALLAAAPAMALADGADGVWATEKNDKGGYLEVTIAPCASDGAKTCGTISGAFTAKGADPAYPHLGASIISGMTHDGDGSYSGGSVWDPEDNKTYDSKMQVKGDVLDVEGCVSIFCRGQDWKRVKH